MAKISDAEIRLYVDLMCDEFEESLRNGTAPVIEDLTSAAPASIREQLLLELLILELEWAARSGRALNLSEYEPRFADNAATVQSAIHEVRSWASESSAVSHVIKTQLDTVADAHANDTVSTQPSVTPADVEASTNHSSGASKSREASERISRYRVVRPLGEGGMGCVLLVYDPELERNVALKLPRLDLEFDSAAQTRFRREARAMASVHHPNLCPIHDVGEVEGQPYLTMTYIDGPTLAEKIDKSGPSAAADAAALVRKISLAVQAMHDAGLLHRDLKPSNVMIRQDNGEPYIMDFGLATRNDSTTAIKPEKPDSSTHDQQPGLSSLQADVSGRLTAHGAIVGSPAYMAPEQARGDEPHAQTDIYALGVILYEMLCGRRPFQGNAAETITALTTSVEPPRPSKYVEIDSKLEAVCMQAMALDPDQRFQTPAELAAALRPFCDGDSERSVAPSRIVASIAILVTAVAGLLWMNPLDFAATPANVTDNVASVTDLASADKGPLGRSADQENLSTDGGEIDVPESWPTVLSNGWRIGFPESPGPAINSDANDANPTLSADGTMLLFYSKRESQPGLWAASRLTNRDAWTPPAPYDWPLQGLETDPNPHLSKDGLVLMFNADIEGTSGKSDLWEIKRASVSAPWSEPKNLGDVVNSEADEYGPCLSADGLTLLFASFREGGLGDSDLWISLRSHPSADWGEPANLGPIINSDTGDGAPTMSSDGLALAFESRREGTAGVGDLWMSTRESPGHAWNEPVNLGELVNSPTWDAAPEFAEDDSAIYFSTRRLLNGDPEGSGRPNIWRVKVQAPSPSVAGP